MSEKWEVVGTGKPRKPYNANGQPKKPAQPMPTKSISSVNTPPKVTKRKKHVGPRENKIAKLPGDDDEETEQNYTSAAVAHSPNKPSKKPTKQPPPKPNESKPKDLKTALNKVSSEQLKIFYQDLKSAGSGGDVYLSWIKYSADALNTQLLSCISTGEGFRLPFNSQFPVLPNALESVIQSIIIQTCESEEDVDVIGLSFSSLLSSIPSLVMRGKECWGYLLFLREMCKIDPHVGSRRSRTLQDLMNSYGNQKDVGMCLLWVEAQICLYSDNVLKILINNIFPYYSFKNYKPFAMSVTAAVADSPVINSSSNVFKASEFEAFFEVAFDPKTRRDFDEVYSKIRNTTLCSLRDQGPEIFFKFLSKLSDKTFATHSPYGQEVLRILNDCLEQDTSIIKVWSQSFGSHLRESIILLNYLAKHPETIHYSKQLEFGLFQADEFSKATTQHPELSRIAKKLKAGCDRVEASRKKYRFPWKMSFLLILFIIGGIVYIDVNENGKGIFAESRTGKFLSKYGLLEKAQFLIDTTRALTFKLVDMVLKAVRACHEGIRPLLQSLEKQAKFYAPQVIDSVSTVGNLIYEKFLGLLDFLQHSVFIGPLSPANLRKTAKDTLTFIWKSVSVWTNHLYQMIAAYISGQ